VPLVLNRGVLLVLDWHPPLNAVTHQALLVAARASPDLECDADIRGNVAPWQQVVLLADVAESGIDRFHWLGVICHPAPTLGVAGLR
jgi:hypothetical protein